MYTFYLFQNSQLKIYQSLEQNGMIYVWNHNKASSVIIILDSQGGQHPYVAKKKIIDGHMDRVN